MRAGSHDLRDFFWLAIDGALHGFFFAIVATAMGLIIDPGEPHLIVLFIAQALVLAGYVVRNFIRHTLEKQSR